jgi:ABC-type multidrug transport system ATPase subunit
MDAVSRRASLLSSPSKSPQSEPVTQSEEQRISLDRISKVFGRVAAVRETTIDFVHSKIYVLLGDNGAGKSTLLRMIAGLAQPTSGSISFHGFSREQMGYMAHASLLYDELSGMENLRYFGQLYGARGEAAESRCASVMSSVALDPALAIPVRDYSQGMRQRLSLARAIVHSPQVILLDEPFSNVDSASASQMTALLSKLRAAGCTIILITHQISIVKDCGDEFITLRAGQVISMRRRGQLRPTEIIQ